MRSPRLPRVVRAELNEPIDVVVIRPAARSPHPSDLPQGEVLAKLPERPPVPAPPVSKVSPRLARKEISLERDVGVVGSSENDVAPAPPRERLAINAAPATLLKANEVHPGDLPSGEALAALAPRIKTSPSTQPMPLLASEPELPPLPEVAPNPAEIPLPPLPSKPAVASGPLQPADLPPQETLAALPPRAPVAVAEPALPLLPEVAPNPAEIPLPPLPTLLPSKPAVATGPLQPADLPPAETLAALPPRTVSQERQPSAVVEPPLPTIAPPQPTIAPGLSQVVDLPPGETLTVLPSKAASSARREPVAGARGVFDDRPEPGEVLAQPLPTGSSPVNPRVDSPAVRRMRERSPSKLSLLKPQTAQPFAQPAPAEPSPVAVAARSTHPLDLPLGESLPPAAPRSVAPGPASSTTAPAQEPLPTVEKPQPPRALRDPADLPPGEEMPPAAPRVSPVRPFVAPAAPAVANVSQLTIRRATHEGPRLTADPEDRMRSIMRQSPPRRQLANVEATPIAPDTSVNRTQRPSSPGAAPVASDEVTQQVNNFAKPKSSPSLERLTLDAGTLRWRPPAGVFVPAAAIADPVLTATHESGLAATAVVMAPAGERRWDPRLVTVQPEGGLVRRIAAINAPLRVMFPLPGVPSLPATPQDAWETSPPSVAEAAPSPAVRLRDTLLARQPPADFTAPPSAADQRPAFLDMADERPTSTLGDESQWKPRQPEPAPASSLVTAVTPVARPQRMAPPVATEARGAKPGVMALLPRVREPAPAENASEMWRTRRAEPEGTMMNTAASEPMRTASAPQKWSDPPRDEADSSVVQIELGNSRTPAYRPARVEEPTEPVTPVDDPPRSILSAAQEDEDAYREMAPAPLRPETNPDFAPVEPEDETMPEVRPAPLPRFRIDATQAPTLRAPQRPLAPPQAQREPQPLRIGDHALRLAKRQALPTIRGNGLPTAAEGQLTAGEMERMLAPSDEELGVSPAAHPIATSAPSPVSQPSAVTDVAYTSRRKTFQPDDATKLPPSSAAPADEEPQTGSAPMYDDQADEKPLTAIGVAIGLPAGDEPPDLAANKFAAYGEIVGSTGVNRPWAPTTVAWCAAASRHRPLYFEDVNLERYGHRCCGCCCCRDGLQALCSAVHFYGTVPLLPYLTTTDPPCETKYTLGHYRPGRCAPHQCHWVPLDPVAATVEGGLITGLIFLIP